MRTGGRWRPKARPEGHVALPDLPGTAPTEERVRSFATALAAPDPRALLNSLTRLSTPEAAVGRLIDLIDAPAGPGDDASAEELAEAVRPDQSPVVLYEVLDNTACPLDLALQMTGREYPVAVRAEVVRQGWPGAARRAVTDPHPYVRALAIEAWDLDDASAEALRVDASANRAQQVLLGLHNQKGA